ncbi:MAG TPA: sigma-70 family RNA polymerase sigma factor, partial [Planctomycetota bacterium]|nr:sigma-70 family RNA polymerase sigma factor [Planctomycetota bacterium]
EVPEEHELAEDPGSASPSQAVPDSEEAARKKARLEEEMEHLPEPDRTIIRRGLHGKNEREIACELGLSYDLVRQRRHRALARLKEALRGEFAA